MKLVARNREVWNKGSVKMPVCVFPRLKVPPIPLWAGVLTTSFAGLQGRHFEVWISCT